MGGVNHQKWVYYCYIHITQLILIRIFGGQASDEQTGYPRLIHPGLTLKILNMIKLCEPGSMIDIHIYI